MHCSRCSNETDLLLERLGGYIVRCTWCHTDISLYLPISWGVTLTFPYIFLLVEVSHWHFFISSYYLTVSNLLSLTTLKSEEFTLSSGSFNWGRYIIRCTWCHTDISLYLPITWLFRICSHWLHWKVKSSLWALAVSNGGVYCKMYLVSHWHFLISSYYLTVSNLLSLTALKSEEFTLSSGSFKWGGIL